MKKLADCLLTVFAYGIIACLFAGGISIVGYLAGIIIGGEIAVNLCAWVFKSYLPWVIKSTSIVTGVGLIGMYLNKQNALTAAAKKK